VALERLVAQSFPDPATAVREARDARRLGDAAPAAAEDPADFETWRERYLAARRMLQARIDPLRRRLRTAVAVVSPDLARLAAVDEVMAQVVGARERERTLAALVPRRLELRFARLRAAHPDAPAAWQERFRHDAREVLRAELDHRWLPVEALLAALRGPAPSATSP
jgi:hypothetical protein